MNIKARALLLASLILLVTLFSVYPHSSLISTSSGTVSQYTPQSASPERTLAFKWYSFFDVPIKPDVWARREARYGGKDKLISATYPVVYLWQPELGWNYFYTSARLKATARELPEIWVDQPEFLPYNLLGALELGVSGGTAEIKNWYLDYMDEARRAELKFPPGSWDGYNTELKGDVVMDKSATKKILGITEAQYQSLKADPAGWWAANENNVETAWSTWLHDEDTRLNIFPFFEYPFTDWPGRYTDYLSLSYDAGLDQVTLTMDMITWGMECLLARWFQETFMPGYEWWWDDFKFNATIGPSLTNIDMDTAVQWAMYMWSYNDTRFADPVWVWEAVRGDIPDVAYEKGVTTSPAYPYYRKTYYVVAPGNEWYDRYGDYDYTPSAFNLKQGETLTFDWSNVYQKGPIWGYKQQPWGLGQKPIDALLNVSGNLKLSVETSEPYGDWGNFPSQINYDLADKTVTYTGPINMTELSFNNIRSQWARLADPRYPNGLLPWGEPFLEFRLVQHDIAVSSVTPSVTDASIGQTVDIDVTVVNFGTTPETFSVTAYYDSTPIGTKTVTSLGSGQSTTLTFNWDTTGVAKGNYKIKATAGPVSGETYTADNTLQDGTVRIAELHDVAVTSVSASPPSVVVGDNVTITAVVKNIGVSTETFDVTAYANTTNVGTKTVASLGSEQSQTLTFKWNTTGMATGRYTIKAVASTVPGETSTLDNTYIDGEVTVKLPTAHDIVVMSVTAAPTTVTTGEDVNIEAVVKNDGTSTESFNVTTFYNSTQIQKQLVSNLQPDANVTLSFVWSTTGVDSGNYVIKVSADEIPGEIYVEDNTYVNGIITVRAIVHDVAVIGVSASPPTVNIGENVAIVVTVKNKGTATETFDVTAFYDGNAIETKSITSLAPNDTSTPIFTWVTAGVAEGNYTIKAVAIAVPGETSTLDNTYINGQVVVRIPPVRDIAVISVSASPTTVNIGDNVTITVVVKNNGTIAETTSITVYRNLTIIATRPDVSLGASEEKTLTFSWNTTGVAEGKYTIKATAATVPGETDSADNTYVDGTITLTQPSPPPGPAGLPLEIIGLIIGVVIVIGVVAAAYLYRRRKKPSTSPPP